MNEENKEKVAVGCGLLFVFGFFGSIIVSICLPWLLYGTIVVALLKYIFG